MIAPVELPVLPMEDVFILRPKPTKRNPISRSFWRKGTDWRANRSSQGRQQNCHEQLSMARFLHQKSLGAKRLVPPNIDVGGSGWYWVNTSLFNGGYDRMSTPKTGLSLELENAEKLSDEQMTLLWKDLQRLGTAIGAESLQYVVDGQPVGILNELAQMKDSGKALELAACDDSFLPDEARSARRQMLNDASVPVNVVRRLLDV